MQEEMKRAVDIACRAEGFSEQLHEQGFIRSREGEARLARRLSKTQQQHILRETGALARFLTTNGIKLPEVKQAAGQLKTDLISAYRHGITDRQVDRETYLAQCKKEKAGNR